MTVKAYETTRIAELERPDGWSPIRRHLGVASFGINAFTAHEPGARLIPEHDEEPSGHEEVYIVTAGHATFAIDGEHVEAPAGAIVFVRDPAARRAAVAGPAGTTILAIGGRPGAPYRPRSWELNSDVIPLFERGEHAAVRAILIEALDSGVYEDSGGLLYNLACAEAQLGEADRAIEHLRAAVREQPSLAVGARDDPDFEPIQGHAGFAEIVAAP